MNKPPAFQFYPKDWNDIKVQRMNYEAQGVYMRILCFMWNDSRDQCSIINDDNMISRALGISKQRWLKNKKEILFDGDPILRKKRNKLISKRLQLESQKLKEYRQMQSEKGKKSALIRGIMVQQELNNGSTNEQPKGNSSSSSSSSSSLSPLNKVEDNKRLFLIQEFETLWKAYHPDGRKNKAYALKRFRVIFDKGELGNFIKGMEGYANFLEFKKKKENFEQRVQYFSTFCTNYKEYIKYYGHKVEPNL